MTESAPTMAKPYLPAGPLDPLAGQIAAFFAANPIWTGMMAGSIAETRAAIRAGTPVTGEPVIAHVEDLAVPVKGGSILARLYRPVDAPPAIILWAHGGGFALGSVDEVDGFSRLLAHVSGCAVVSVEYRLAPEHRFPIPLDDVAAAIRWVFARRALLAGGEVPLFAGGDSSGANLVTVATRRLHASGEGRIAGNLLAYPCTDNAEAESLRRFEPPFLTLREVTFFLDQYLADPDRRTDPDFAPLYAANLSDLPPTLLLTAEHDIITEQAEGYAARLSTVGVPVEIIRYPGMIHGFLTIEAFFEGAAGQAIRDMSTYVARRLEGA